MSVNKKLFELGNDVVKLHKIITTHFSRPGDPDFDGIPFREIFDEMLRLINVIRMEACHVPDGREMHLIRSSMNRGEAELAYQALKELDLRFQIVIEDTEEVVAQN